MLHSCISLAWNGVEHTWFSTWFGSLVAAITQHCHQIPEGCKLLLLLKKHDVLHMCKAHRSCCLSTHPIFHKRLLTHLHNRSHTHPNRSCNHCGAGCPEAAQGPAMSPRSPHHGGKPSSPCMHCLPLACHLLQQWAGRERGRGRGSSCTHCVVHCIFTLLLSPQ